ncbi:hypothetical protein IPZ58_10895 [Streptomyces roseoverticillatus]|uniref:hypothetical protein n=1 Tax=Streptomyces roseoverticillatus TaxID=66429 RepID=UPI001F3D4BF5|nr:hypothetical protein [Streptomyces roseoverticillatus]MCF3102092.1 hypothetical protein [Streptomyces roseoverticillatus]
MSEVLVLPLGAERAGVPPFRWSRFQEVMVSLRRISVLGAVSGALVLSAVTTAAHAVGDEEMARAFESVPGPDNGNVGRKVSVPTQIVGMDINPLSLLIPGV